MVAQDIEKQSAGTAHAEVNSVRTLSWTGVTVTVTDKSTKQSIDIVTAVNGHVKAGK